MKEVVKTVCTNCLECQQKKISRKKHLGSHMIISNPEGAMTDILIDLFGPIQEKNDRITVIVAIDRFSRLIVAKTRKVTPSTRKLLEFVDKKIFPICGYYPSRILSDRGTQFTSK
jgi:hypothetical protein